MNYNHPNHSSSTINIRLMCATVFLVFSFVYLYFFQAEILAVAQHVLSHGVTSYNRLIGALLITAVLQMFQLLVCTFIRLQKRSYAVTYFPSMLLLAFITDINSDIDLRFSLGGWYWVMPLVLVAWLALSMLLKAMQDIEPDVESTSLFSRPMWINMLTMAFFIVCVVAVSNSDAVFHYRARAEARLMRDDYTGALEVGERSLESDANLQMIRMYALAQRNELGERLFAYPIVGKSDVMLPVEGKSRFAIFPVDSMYKALGAKPGNKMTNSRYLQLLLHRDTLINRRVVDYQLCGLLIDKQLDAFVSQLVQYYSVSDSLDTDHLPKHYREALTLYTHLRSHPIQVYHNAVMDEDWNNLQELERMYSDTTERKVKVGDLYRGTYWYYYGYQ